ncbi:hypothetical protein AOL_s00043g576 [Orbilia oligospora ATCC 24927]|uniref:Uncharacterized protein n=1 Tax=Arthrobotrys oligospora (strain ATCC 24927 / CBS 115.81 / DSM 1491) TaxID=756982 RepID=G1X4F2_ARTOA|nr:hypothetical protein AOL_s00043g576 [Orbilia oligospora ATCC 24927]EGX51842.1 hypothetical protein AOL_s00043g576 [Orbilia oligospora ATCC 24927]
MAESVIENYTVGWICALQEEYEAACRMLDDEFEAPDELNIDMKDDNTYEYGMINGHYVVIGCLPSGRYGTVSAAIVAKDMVRSFPNLRFALMVGIGGGAPTNQRDIRLGDVVVSQPEGDLGGVVQFDLGKRLQEEGEGDGADGRGSSQLFRRTGQLNAPPSVLLGAMPRLLRLHRDTRRPDKLAEHIKLMDDMASFRRPSQDQLYRSNYLHQSAGKTCQNCQEEQTVERPPRDGSREVMIHYGTIASSNTLMKNAIERDRYAREVGILCFEMEAAGLMNNLPCLVIRGICDYSDSHKNDEWHNYAALTAAAYARELLNTLRPAKIQELPSWAPEFRIILKDIQKDVVVSKNNMDVILHHQVAQEEEKIIEWLTPIDYGTQQSDFLNRRYPGTGSWLLESEEYQKWIRSPGTGMTLFCPGIPGAGKTILMSIVIDDLYQKYRTDSDTCIAYVYFSFKQQLTEEEFFSYLLKKLSMARPSLPEEVRLLYEDHKKEKTRPTVQEVLRALKTVMSLYEKLFFAVDALDECQSYDDGGCRGRILDRLFELQAEYGVNIFATSRFILDISNRFERLGSAMLKIRATDEDIRRYLDDQVSRSERPLLKSYREEIITEITKAVDGMFLLAQLHFRNLCTKKSLKKLLDGLKTLPTGSEAYYKAYESAMKRVDGQDTDSRELGMNVISWVTCSMKPLTIIELQHALGVELEGMESTGMEFDEINISTVEDIISVCAGLVTIDAESKIIRIAHYTAQQYFEETQQKWFPRVEANITDVCVTYLSLKVFKTESEEMGKRLGNDRMYINQTHVNERVKEKEKRLGLYPFYEYAANNWGHHARKLASQKRPRLMEFLSCQSILDLSLQVTISKHQIDPWTMTTALHMAAYFGLIEVVKSFIESGADVNTKDFWGQTPLCFAAKYGHQEIVRLLLAHPKVYPDCIPNETGKPSFRAPLSFAAENGHSKIVQIFLKDRRIDPNSKSRDPHERQNTWTPLSYAAREGHEEVVRILLNDPRVDPDFTARTDYGQSRSPLSLAAGGGYEEVVRILLADPRIKPDSKAAEYAIDNINQSRGENWTPLFFAARRGHEGVVRMLLQDPRVNPNARAKNPTEEEENRTALSYAAEYGWDGVVKVLIADPRIDINVKSEPYRWETGFVTGSGGLTPLSYATIHGKEAVVRLLLAAPGIDPNACSVSGSYLGDSPLLLAVKKNRGEITKFLLAHEKVNPNQRGYHGETALYWAVKNNLEDMTKMLLAHPKIEVNNRFYNEETILIRASRYGLRAMVRLLLSRKDIDTSIKDSSGKTALLHAEFMLYRQPDCGPLERTKGNSRDGI